jgi:radical SAM superfamily enzyme YgiQ (UPF0313 family)
MREGGFETVRLGYETSQRRHRADTAGKADRTELARAVGVLRKSGFTGRQVGVYVMAGLPGQTPDDVIDEIDFVGSLAVLVKPVCLSPVPRTQLFEHYSAQYPQLRSDPLWHNDTFFVTRLKGWSWDAVQDIRDRARERNGRVNTG